MRHRYPIINLRDKPMYRRPSMWSHHYAAPQGHRATLAAISLLVVLIGGVSGYTYFLRPTLPAAPILTPQGGWHDSRAEALRLVAPSAPEPDMDSPAVAFADADVPKDLVARVAAAFKPPEPPVVREIAAVEPAKKKRKVRAARRLSPEAADSYASGFNVFQPPFGGW
jgi:hypothetical protein